MNYFFRLSLLLPFIAFCIHSKAQNSALQPYEISFLDLIRKDTVNNLDFNLKTKNMSFGFPSEVYTEIFLAKRKKEIIIHPLGSGQIFKVYKKKNEYHFNRIDSTYHTGANFNSFSFFMRDTLFQYGGGGFWNIRGFITYFSNKTKQWELLNSNRSIQNLNTEFELRIVKANTALHKLYLTNSLVYADFPKSFFLNKIDSCYEFDFNTRKWTTLGKINPLFKDKLNNAFDLQSNLPNYTLFTRDLEFYWVNFSTNNYGSIKEAKKNEIKQEWIRFFPTSKYYKYLNFCLGDTLYFVKINSKNILEYVPIALKESDFNLTNVDFIYNDEANFPVYFMTFLRQYDTYLFLLLFAIGLIIAGILFRNNKKNTLKTVDNILYLNFFNTLSIIEKELINQLLTCHKKGETLNTKLINKIIGVQHKDVLNQNKSRSDYFIKMNQKFNIATQQKFPLIIKIRDEEDKRQFNYSLNKEYISEFERLFKTK